MDTVLVLLIVALCAFVLVRKIYKQIKSGKCDCGCDNNCGSCNKSDSCMTNFLNTKTKNVKKDK